MMVDLHMEHPAKRRRLSSLRRDNRQVEEASNGIQRDAFLKGTDGSMENGHESTIGISSSSKLTSQTIAPFLAKHIPNKAIGQGSSNEHASKALQKDPNTKYCYRHHPDLKCRRQANEPSMDQLQHELQSLPQNDQQGIAHVWTLFSAAPSKHRDLMLQGILAQCCFPQLSMLSTRVRELIKIDFLSALPPEIGFKVLRYLDTTSLCKAAQVSRRWRLMADDDVVWHKMCEQHIARKCKQCGWGLPLLERKRLMASKQHIQMRALARPNMDPAASKASEESQEQSRLSTGKGTASVVYQESQNLSSEFVTPNTDTQVGLQRFRPWKDVYKDRFKVGSNWKHGRYSTKIFKGHTNGVMCLQFDEHILATGSYDATIKIWNVETGAEIRTLRGHSSGVRSLQFDGNKLISGSLDRTIRVWNWRTGECVRTLTGHSDGVISIHFASAILASGSIDHSIRIWNFEDASTTILRGHTDWVNSVKIDMASRTLFSASDDLTVKLWDLDTKKPIKVFKGHVGHVQQVIPLPVDFELEDNEPELYDSSDESSSSQSTEATAAAGDNKPGLRLVFEGDRPLPPRYMLTSALDCNIRLWDVHTGKCLRTFFGHVEGVWAIAADTLRMVSGAEDRMVKIWDPRSGRCQRTFTGHEGPVACIGLSDSRICTGSEDGDVRMMCFKENQECRTLESGC